MLIIDDQPIVARGLTSLIRDEVGVPVYQSAGRREAWAAELADYRPRLIVLGVSTDVRQAREQIGLVRAVDRLPRLAVLAPATLGLEPTDLVRFDVSSVVSRTASLDEIVLAIRQALLGRIAIDSATAARLLADLAQAVSRNPSDLVENGLTRRELQVLELVADGLPNRDVANQLHISENTVKNHMRSIHDKLDVRTRTEAVVKAARSGLLGIR